MEKRKFGTIISYPERGVGGNAKYRGNCSPEVIKDLIGFYQPAEISDFMCGSGTTGDAARDMGIPANLYDLHSGFDMMTCDIPVKSQFTFWHPPYWDIVKYSDNMYKAQDVLNTYGYDPRNTDLSRIGNWDEFVNAMNYCCLKQFTALEKGGRMAVLMGDIKKKGKLYSMLAEIVKPGTLEQIIIKAQHNCWSDKQQYSGNFIPIQHEYIMVVRKDDSLIIPVMLNKKVEADIRDMKNATWRDVVAAVLDECEGPVPLRVIYERVEPHKKARENPHWQDKIRQTLQYYPEYFWSDTRGVWGKR